MSLCISSLAWNINNKIDIYSFFNKNDIKYIEIVPSKISKLGILDNYNNYIKLKKEWEDFGLKAVSMQSLHYNIDNSFLFGSKLQRENFFNYTLKAMEMASILEINHIVFGSPKLRIIPNDMSMDESNEISHDFFNRISIEACKHNVVIGLEPNSKEYGTNFLTNTLETYNFIKKINLKNIKLNLDLSTIILEKENISDSVHYAGNLNYNFHSHISIPFLKNNYLQYEYYIKDYLINLYKSTVNHYSIETVINTDDTLENIDIINNIIELIRKIEKGIKND